MGISLPIVFILVVGSAVALIGVTTISNTPTEIPGSASGLQLGVSVSQSVVGFYQSFTIKTDLANRLDSLNNITTRQLAPEFTAPCAIGVSLYYQAPWPYGVAILYGRYGTNNLSEALNSSDVVSGESLPKNYMDGCAYYARSLVSYYSFSPESNLATPEGNGRNFGHLDLNLSVTAHLPAIGGSYTKSNATAGYVFTVVVADEWGDVAFAYVTAAGPWATRMLMSCDSPSFLAGSTIGCQAAVGESLGLLSGNITWSSFGKGDVSFSQESCTTLLSCSVTITGIEEGWVTVVASYGGSAYLQPSKGENVTLVSDPAVASSAIVQHTFVLPITGEPRLNVTLPSPVTRGNLLVVGVVFASNSSGSVSDSLSNRWTGTPYSDDGSDTGTSFWWATTRVSGNDTVTITSDGTVELVEVFEIRGAHESTAGVYSAGAIGPGLENNTWIAQGGLPPPYSTNETGLFILAIAGAYGTGRETCVPYTSNSPSSPNYQTAGFTIEPYCGDTSPFSGQDVFGEYFATDNPGTIAQLGVTRPFTGWVVWQIFSVSIDLNSSSIG